jgi:chromosome segregation ATPase
MTNEEMQKAIEFLLEHHAKFSTDIGRLEATQAQTTTDLQLLTGKVAELTDNVSRLEVQMDELRDKVDTIITEMRDGFNKLILANEGTRDLAEKVAQLAVSTSQRVSRLEEKI